MAEEPTITQVEHEQGRGRGVDSADVRTAGYCVVCNRIVKRTAVGDCPEGHPAVAISGRVPLSDSEPVPELGRFNLAAFLIPPLWGPIHRQWAGAIFLPLWLFADSVVGSALGRGTGMLLGAAFVVCMTVVGQAWFASRANGLAWRVLSPLGSPQDFMRGQRWWALVSVPLACALFGWGVWYRFVLA